MKEITMRVSDELSVFVKQWAEYIPDVEMVTDDDYQDDQRDVWFKEAVMMLKQDGVIRKPRDYAWIMAAIEQDLLEDYEGFYSSQAFIDYLAMIGIDNLPERTTLYRAYNLIDGEYPEWTFMDDPDDREVSRRKNVVLRFKSAFFKAKRTYCNSLRNN